MRDVQLETSPTVAMAPPRAALAALATVLVVRHTIASTSGAIGANVDGVADYSYTLAFVDLTKQSRAWGSEGTPWDGNCSTGDGGWPMQSSFGNIWLTLPSPPLDAYTPSSVGNYSLIFTGSAAVAPNPVMRGTFIEGQAYDAATDTTTATLVVGPDNAVTGCNCIMLGFTNASNVANGTGLRDVKLLQPGYSLAQAGDFSAPLLTLLGRFSVLRFMDW